MTLRPFMKQRMLDGEAQLGAFVMCPSPAIVEMFGYSGYDFVIIDREHGAAGLETLENCLRAAEASGMEALVRVPDDSTAQILSSLDAGASGIVVPHVTTADQAQAIAQAAVYPPHGKRGFATTSRAGRHGSFSAEEHFARTREKVLVMVQIEDAEALPNVREIAGIEGIDAAFIGPADLAMSLGVGADLKHPKVASAIDQVLTDIKASGQAMAAAFAPDRAELDRLLCRGVRMICMSGTQIVGAAIRQSARDFSVR